MLAQATSPQRLSFRLLRNYRLADARILIGFYFLHIALSTFTYFLYMVGFSKAVSQNIFFTVGYQTVSHFLYLMISIMAVRFVAGSYEEDDGRDDLRDLYVEDL